MSASKHKRKLGYPRYSLPRVFSLRDKLVYDVLTDLAGYPLTGKYFEEFVSRLLVELSGVSWQTMYDSVRELAGDTVTNDILYATAWRLAGNLSRLRDGQAVPMWTMQTEPEWMPAQFVAYFPTQDIQGNRVYEYSLRILAGTACPLRIDRRMSRSVASRTALELGYTNSRGHFRLGDVSELVGLRAWLKIDPARCRHGQPGFFEIGCSSGLLKWNHAVIHKRFRKNWKCPKNYLHHCFLCPVGYTECPAATHKDTVIERTESNGSATIAADTGTES